MAGKSSGGGGGGLVKNKGPRGKRAREKARIDRRWGEREDDDGEESHHNKRIRRFGRSRLMTEPPHRAGTLASAPAADLEFLTTRGAAGEMPRGKVPRGEVPRGEVVGAQNMKRRGVRRDEDRSDRSGGSYSGSSSDDGSSTEEDEVRSSSNGDDALGPLLRVISGSKKRAHRKRSSRAAIAASHHPTDSSCDEEEDGANDKDEEESEGEDDEASSSSGDDDNKDEKSIDGDDAPNGVSYDPYASHFSRPPLPEDRAAIESDVIAPLRRTKKVPGGTAHLNEALEVSLSGDLLKRLKEAIRGHEEDEVAAEEEREEDKAAKARRAWNGLASDSWGRVRALLRWNWKSANSGSVRSNADGITSIIGKKGGVSKKKRSLFSDLQATVFPALFSFADLNLCGMETPANRGALHDLMALHVLNHVLTARTRVARHDKRIRELSEMADEEDGDGGGKSCSTEEEDEERWKDQGYTRPKVLVLLPTRGTCLEFVRLMLALVGWAREGSDSSAVENLDRFEAAYGVNEAEVRAAQEGDMDRRKSVLDAKGPEWKALFADEVNSDDEFKIGISFGTTGRKNARRRATAAASNGGKVSVRLYQEFYRSDIVLASPLGLKMAVSESGDGDGDTDFLSSIEVCLILRADVLLMQNWDHVSFVLDCLNRQPTRNNNTDFSRVRPFLLAGQARYWRQTVLLSAVSDPHLQSAFKRHASSVGGRMRMRRTVPADRAAVCDVLVPGMRQVFRRIPPTSSSDRGGPGAKGDDLLGYFADKVLPRLLRMKEKHTLIYVPSYFDFVAMRNLLLKKEASFVSVTEYARTTEVGRGRARFMQGRKHIMLYTGRCHFFLRHNIKGARHIIFFGLPEHPEFYPGLVNMLAWGGMKGCDGKDEDAGGMDAMGTSTGRSCLALFTRYDAHALEGIVGTAHCNRMISCGKGTFLFRS